MTTSYFINDHLDSLAVITDEMGAVKERLAYDPWGKRRYADGSDDPTWSITSESNRGFTGHEQMDEVGLVNMNARLYDPEVGRFVSPDPYIQYAEDSQSYNRYAYARNNPLSITDPSGNFFFALSAIVSFVISAVSTYLISQLPFMQDLLSNPIIAAIFQIASAYVYGIQGAALSAIAVSSANGGSIGDAIKAAAVAAATAGAFEQVGSWVKAGEIGTAGKIALHAAVGCASAAASGGKCAAGAAAAGFSAAAGSIIPGKWSKPVQVGARSVIGGVAAELGGGKFANGAVTAAFGYLFNDLLHPDEKPKKMNENTKICSEGCNVVNVNVSGGIVGEVGASYLKVYDKVTGLQHEFWTGDLSVSFGGLTKVPASLVMSVEWGRIPSAVSLGDLSGWGLTTSATLVVGAGISVSAFSGSLEPLGMTIGPAGGFSAGVSVGRTYTSYRGSAAFASPASPQRRRGVEMIPPFQ